MKKASLFACCFLLAACASGEVRDTLGLNRAAPDEFKVVSRPPLSLPPDFQLRPPSPGEPPRVSGSTEDQARRAVLGGKEPEAQALRQPEAETALTPVVSGDLPTTGEAALLDRLGVSQADPAIRSKLSTDRSARSEALMQDKDATVLDRLLGIDGKEPVVDPFAEAERLRTNKDAAKPLNEGEVPTIDAEDRSTLEKLFD